MTEVAQAQVAAQPVQSTGIAAGLESLLANPTKTVETNVRKINGYEIGNVLGKGGFSEVFLGFDRKNNRRVALKCMFNDPNVKSQEKQIVAELSAMGKIQHDNVVKLYDSDTKAKFPMKDESVRDTILVVLELATGGELFDYLMYTGKFEEKLARTYFRQLIDGLEACHKQGVAHRDLKPENLLLDSNMVLKMADFGFASVFNEEGNRKYMLTECGTRAYMAPEILAHKKYDETADIWACGIIAFIMMGGFPPLQVAKETDWWYHKLKIKRHNLFWAAHERTTKFSADAKSFIEAILCAAPGERITIEKMREHKWFKGEVYSAAETKQLMTRRKTAADARKKEERRKERQKRTAHRGVEDDEFLPLSNPTMQSGAVMNEFVEGKVGDWEDEPPKYDANAVMESCTQFTSEEEPRAILCRVAEITKSLEGKVYMDARNYNMNGEVNTQLGSIRFACQALDNDNGTTIVFNRQGGNPVNWMKLYDENFAAKMLDVIDDE